MGFDFHHPSNLRGVQGNRSNVNIHQLITNEWAKWQKENMNATREDIEDFAQYIDEKYEQYWWK